MMKIRKQCPAAVRLTAPYPKTYNANPKASVGNTGKRIKPKYIPNNNTGKCRHEMNQPVASHMEGFVNSEEKMYRHNRNSKEKMYCYDRNSEEIL
jgi:hypothetical protein